MKKFFRTVAFFLAVPTAHTAFAQSASEAVQDGFGIGAVVGEPIGFSASLPTGDNSIDVVIGTEFQGGPNLTILGAYLWHDRNLIAVPSGTFSVYYGPGFRVRLASESMLGARAVVGFGYVLPQDPLQVYFELGPGINIVPDTRFQVTLGIGARYFF